MITETWIRDPELFEPLEQFIAQIIDFTRSKNLSFFNTDLVLDCTLDMEGVPWCGYYYVCHSSRTLFWLEDYPIDHHLKKSGANSTSLTSVRCCNLVRQDSYHHSPRTFSRVTILVENCLEIYFMSNETLQVSLGPVSQCQQGNRGNS